MEKHTILIVDDEEMVIKTIERTLLDENCILLTALSGQEGLAKLANHEVSMVISDQKMPGMSGLEFLDRVKTEYPDILTIMLTAYADIEVAVKAINEIGIYKFILKPFDVEVFKITIKRALESLHLVKECKRLMQQVQNHEAILRNLEKQHPGITRVEKDEYGNVLSL